VVIIPDPVDNYFYPIIAGIGTHLITYTFQDTAGCTNFAQDSIYVDGCTSVAENNPESRISVNPNPADGNFILRINTVQEEDISIRIFDQYSKLVFDDQKSLSPAYSEYEISAAHLPEGMYYLLITGKNIRHLEKIVIMK